MRTYVLPTAALRRFESSGVEMDFLPVATDAATTRVTVARIAAGGTLGSHAATLAQAFAVVEGNGYVATDGGPRCDVGPGTLVIWEKGEVHQTWAVTPMLAVIVETAGRFDVAEGFGATELPRS